MRNLLPKKSKKGITLVETVIAVVVLAILTTGILSLMTAGGRKILLMSKEASDQAAAAQQLDLVIAAISNGDSRTEGNNPYILKDTSDKVNYCCLNINALFSALGLEKDKVTLVATIDLYDENDTRTISKSVKVGEENVTMTLRPVNNVRGWYLELTYKDATAKGVTVKGFVSNSEGVFDQ